MEELKTQSGVAFAFSSGSSSCGDAKEIVKINQRHASPGMIMNFPGEWEKKYDYRSWKYKVSSVEREIRVSRAGGQPTGHRGNHRHTLSHLVHFLSSLFGEKPRGPGTSAFSHIESSAWFGPFFSFARLLSPSLYRLRFSFPLSDFVFLIFLPSSFLPPFCSAPLPTPALLSNSLSPLLKPQSQLPRPEPSPNSKSSPWSVSCGEKRPVAKTRPTPDYRPS